MTTEHPANADVSNLPVEPAPTGGTARWVDSSGREWHVEWSTDAVVFRSLDEVIEVPAESWIRDFYVAAHGDGFIIRVDRFEGHLAFLVPAPTAIPFLQHLGASRAVAMRKEEQDIDDEAAPAELLLWPKVSPLAVWSLIASSLVFVPAVGVACAIATVVLLLMHRAQVRRSRAWKHSRALCRAAVCFLLPGLAINAVSTWTLSVNLGFFSEGDWTGSWDRREVHLPDAEQHAPVAAEPRPIIDDDRRPPLLRADQTSTPFWKREHNWPLIIAGLLVVLLSLTVHEAAHAVTAWWMGDDFARRLGRVTLNPVAHIDPIGTVVLPLVLLMMNASVWGWAKPVPVLLHNVAHPRRAQILVAIAGPGSNLLLAAASLALLLGSAGVVGIFFPAAVVNNFTSMSVADSVEAFGFPGAAVLGPAWTMLKLMFVVNVFLAFFNLIPIPPLDGSWVLQYSFPRTLGPLFERIRPYSFLIILLFLYSGVIKYLILPALLALIPGFLLLQFCTFF
jgi:Zn-dependent protease